MTEPVNNHDVVNHPKHYTSSPARCECGKPIECIDVIEDMWHNLATVIKYLWRVDLKDNPIQDLQKARWYLTREIKRRQRRGSS
jgi:hypothetical protein